MQPAYVLLATLLVPVGALLLLLWLGRLEETLDASLANLDRPAAPALRAVPATAPVRTVPARAAAVAEPTQWTAAS